MRGHITKRSEGSYSIVLDVGTDPATGRRKQQRVTVRGTKKDAEKCLAELLHALDTGTYAKPGKATLAEYLERWLHDYAWANLSPRTAEGYEYIIQKHLIPGLGAIPLTQLKPGQIQQYLADKLSSGRADGKGGLSPRSVIHQYVTLHEALAMAVKWGVVIRNPVEAVTPPKGQHNEVSIMTENEVNTFLDAAKDTEYYALFHTALYTGMRRSELLALRWSDIDLDMCELSVSRSLHHLRDGRTIFRQPKTASGRRMIALTPSSASVLREHKEAQTAQRILIGKPLADNDLIFAHYDGTPLLPNSVTHAWVKLARRTGLNGIRLHDARHTHASLMLKQGIHPKIVQERLGHSSIQITLDTYSHVSPGLQQAAALKFDELVNKPTKETVSRLP